MSTAELRLHLIEKIMQMDEDELQKFNVLAEAEVAYQAVQTPTLTQAQLEELERRRQRHLAGEGQTFSWEEVKQAALDAINK